MRTLSTLEKGDFFGEMSLLDRVPRTATAVVDEDAELLRVDAVRFQKLLGENVEIAVRMIRKYTARLRETNDKLREALKDRSEVDRGIAEILESVQRTPSPSDAGSPPPPELASLGVFSISKPVVLIGRRDPVTNLRPEIDLTEVDPDRSVSRRHARIERTGGTFFLTEEVGVSNGTYVNGKRLVPGRPTPIADGDRIGFGKVVFPFRATGSES